MKKTKLILLSLGIFASLTNAYADTHDEAIDKLFILLDMKKTQASSIETMVNAQAAQNPIIRHFKSDYQNFMTETLGWNAMKADIAKIYKQNFTETEINELIAFYQTATGKKAITKLPQLFADGARIGQEKIQAKLPEFIKKLEPKMKAFQEEQKKKQKGG